MAVNYLKMSTPVAPVVDEVEIKLLKQEVARYGTHAGIQTCSFYGSGHNSAGMGNTYGLVRNHVRTRVKEVLEANPWMAGHLKTVDTLSYSRVIGEHHANFILKEEARGYAPFTRDDCYTDINLAALKLAGLKPAAAMVKSGQAITQIVVIPTHDNEVAVLFSMSHAVVDGFTYYKILGMLGGAPIEAMDICRPNQVVYNEMEADQSGPEILAYGASATYIKHIVWNNVLKSKPYNAILCKFVDADKVKAAKAQKESLGEAAFVSTNDLLVSQVGRASQVDFMMQTLNYRNRVSLLHDGHAGNYENVCAYDCNGYACAGNVRQSLFKKPFGNIKNMPGFCSKTRMAFYTTWVFQSLPLLEVEGCELQLHIPIICFDPTGDTSKALVCPLDAAITFRSQPDKIAMIKFCCRANPDDYSNEDSVLGASVSENIFPTGLTIKQTNDDRNSAIFDEDSIDLTAAEEVEEVEEV